MVEGVKINRPRELIVWRIRRASRALGWSGVSGLALLVIAVGYYLTNYAPLYEDVSRLEKQVELASTELEQAGPKEAPGTPGRQLDDFYSRLKSQSDVAEVVRRLHGSAREVGLRFVRGDYRPQREASGKILRYQITLPVRGSYPKVRQFLAQALRNEPALALDGVGFQTDRSGGDLETRVQFTLFVGAQG
jgi:hypothetical protein